jgi:uncharacterized protein YjiS (DUF1127 family)
MSAIFSTSLHPEETKTPATGPRIFKNLWARIARYPVRRAAVAHLREVDNDALGDIGLAPSEIEAAVYGRMTGPSQART